MVLSPTFKQYFSYIGGGNQSTRRKQPTCRNSLTKLYHIMLYRVHLVWEGFELTTLVVIDTDCIGNNKCNYHTITTTTAPINYWKLSLDCITAIQILYINIILHTEIWSKRSFYFHVYMEMLLTKIKRSTLTHLK